MSKYPFRCAWYDGAWRASGWPEDERVRDLRRLASCRLWLWRASYLRERETKEQGELVNDAARWAMAAEAHAKRARRYREWLKEAVPYLEQHLATYGEQLAEEIKAELADAGQGGGG